MTYLEALQQAHRIEVNGEATYAAAARRTRDPDHRAKWQVLADLETRMKERVAAEIASRGGVAAERALDIRAGRAAGAVIAALPWRTMLRGLRFVTRRTTRFWERLEAKHPGGNAELLADLTAHERAQVEFARLELSGELDQSLQPVRALCLTRAVERPARRQQWALRVQSRPEVVHARPSRHVEGSTDAATFGDGPSHAAQSVLQQT